MNGEEEIQEEDMVDGPAAGGHGEGHGKSYISPHIGHISKGDQLDLVSRHGASSMDEKRKEHIAYEYLCHLEETKQWIESCIDEELPPTTELEQALRNGVILCKLGHYYAPEVLPLRKIYDLDESKYQVKGLHFKHTDNFNFWLKSMGHIGLPKIFYPETTDLYDRKNMPRVIYCIHALSLFLHKLGVAPEIENLVGTVTFTEDEISAMKSELDKYGISMPSFGKIGGILANEMSMDEAAIHAAVVAINDTLDKDDPQETVAKLANPAACVKQVESDHAARYHALLTQMKQVKIAAHGNPNSSMDVTEADAYDFMLTQTEIQDTITQINTQVKREIMEAKMREAVSTINSCVVTGNKTELLRALRSEEAQLKGVIPENVHWYSDILSKTRKDAEECGEEGELSKQEIQDIIQMANQIAEHTRLVEQAVVAINEVITEENPERFLESLQNTHLSLSAVEPANMKYYQAGLRERLLQKREETGNAHCLLTEDEIQEEVHKCNSQAEQDHNIALAFAGIDLAALGDDPASTMAALLNKYVQIAGLDKSCSARYHKRLRQRREEKGAELTKAEVEKVVAEVNVEVSRERLLEEGVASINAALAQDSESLFQALLNENVGVSRVEKNNVPYYQTLMESSKASKAERTCTPSAILTLEEIQSVVDLANERTKETIEAAQAIHRINVALANGEDSTATLEAIKSSVLALRSITDECSDTYRTKLMEAQRKKAESAGDDVSGWAEHRSKSGHTYYYHPETEQHSWVRPDDFNKLSRQLSQEEIQAIVTRVTADFDRWALLKANEPLIVTLQACWRGALIRRARRERVAYLKKHTAQAITIQAQWKGLQQRRAYQKRKKYFSDHAAVAVKIQSFVRMWRARKEYKKRQQYFRSHVDEVIKIQAFWRAKRTKKDYKQLVEVQQPPASAVRKFLSLLEQKDVDFTEELECQRLKSQVVSSIRSNQQLEQDLNVMDIKIGLLVKNRISLQDVVSHQQQIKRRGAAQLDGTTVGLGGLSKDNQEKIEAYQHLFYLLQTNPRYFAKLIFEMSPSRTNQFMENVILTVLSYAQNTREQYLLVRLFETALEEEIEAKVFKLNDIITGNPTVIKMVIHYTRGVRGQNILRELLGDMVQEVIAQEDLVLNISPTDVYKSWINQMESQTGERSKLPYEVSNDVALGHEEVRQRIQKTIEILKDATERFQQAILGFKIPYTMRYIAMRLRQSLHAKFPEAPEEDVLKVVGNLVYYRYMNPAIVAPDAFDIVDLGVDQSLNADQRRNLGAIAKVLQHAAAGKIFEGENAALSTMNPYIMESFRRFRQFFLDTATVEPPSVMFGYDEYTDVIMVTKPVIQISVKELLRTHSLLVDHEDALCPDPKDPLREILRDLGAIPSVEQLLGGVREAMPNEDPQDVINEASKQELALTLNNKFEGLADESTDMKALFVKTKRMVVDLLKVQPGDNLTTILYTPATPEQEEEHQELIKQREQEALNRSTNTSMLKSGSLYGDRDLPLEGMKRKIMRQLRTLEQEEMVSSKNDYQDIINAIAKDIRNQHRHRQQRKQEIKRLQETMQKLEQKAHFYGEQMQSYQEYVKACLENLARASRHAKTGHEFKRHTVKYSALRLHEKGVVLEIEGLPKHQFRNATIEITSISPGVFEVTGKILGKTIEKVELVFQDLLQLQYEGVAVMKMFGRAKINVNLLIYLINKKFYGKS